MGTTSKYNFPYPEATDVADVPNDMKETLEKVENVLESDFETHKYSLTLTADVSAGTNVTIPCHYKVGSNVLDVYLNGERLLLSSDTSGTNGHYLEVGTTGETSNIIKTTTDWSLASGDYFEFVVKGEYSE